MLASRNEAEDNQRLSIASLICEGSWFDTRVTREMDIFHFKTLVTRATQHPEETLILTYSWAQFDLYNQWISQELDDPPVTQPLLRMAIELNDDRLVSIVEKDDLYQEALNLAATMGQLFVVRDLCRHCESSQLPVDLHGLFFRVVQAGQIEILTYLLDFFGTNKILSEVDLLALLTVAAHEGRLEAIQLLCQQLNIRFNSKFSGCQLYDIFEEAVYSGKIDLLDFFIDYFNLDIKPDLINPTSALVLALTTNNLEVTEFLINRLFLNRSIIFQKDQALAQVCQLCSWPMVQYFIERFDRSKVDLETKNYQPLRMAAQAGSWSVVKFLVHCFKIRVKDLEISGETPVDQKLKEHLLPEPGKESPSNYIKIMTGGDPTYALGPGCIDPTPRFFPVDPYHKL